MDDAVVHCVSEAQARTVLAALEERMAQVGLALHPDKTRIVYCKDGRRRGSYEHTSFTFLGYTFRARGVRTKTGRMMTGFNPAISKDALNKISAQVRSWGLHRRTGLSEADLARWINPIVRGWMNYYGAFYRVGAVSPPDAHQRLPAALAAQEAQTAAGTEEGTGRMGEGRHSNGPGSSPTGPGSDRSPLSGDQNDKSRMTGDCYVRICEGRGVKCPPATRQSA